MRMIVICALFVPLFFGCADKEYRPQASDFAGDYYFVTAANQCASFAIDSSGLVDTPLSGGGVCGTGSRVECIDARCSLTCLEFNASDTTAIFSIMDMRTFGEVLERLRSRSVPDHLALGPYRPKALSTDEWFDGAGAAMADTSALRFDLFFNRVDCEYWNKTAADTMSEK